jgi:PAS domain S-box-containing protein/TyrR family helix-turn-helix protein
MNLRNIAEYSFDNIIVVNSNLNVLWVNSNAENLHREINHGVADAAGFYCNEVAGKLPVLRVLQDGQSRRNVSISFSGRFFLANLMPLSEDKCMIFLRDITKIKDAEKKIEVIEEMNKELNDIIDLSADGLVSVDGNGILLRMNEAYEKIVGVKSEEFVGEPVKQLVEKGYLPETVSQHVMRTLKPKNIYLTINGREVLLTGRPVFNNNGNLIRIVANIRDMTELNSYKEKIQEFQQLTMRYSVELERLRAKEFEGELIGESDKMKKVIDLVIQAAQVDSNILISGETGTGKEMVAKMIHRYSKRIDGPFITVNCGALTESLLESELFGYESGAFTGADKKGRAGLFEAAEGGTLFLDEISEVPLGMQANLLRAIQEKKIRRIGASKEINVDVRLVSATNKNLNKMVAEGSFREDLFYRLNVVRIYVPSLRERKEDIPALTEHFLERFNKKYGYKKRIPEEMILKFMAHSWPGNVRELENTLERLVVLSRGLNLDTEVVRDDLFYRINPLDEVDRPLKEILEETEREIIEKMYREYKSTRKVAVRLGISQASVTRKLQKYRQNKEK